MRLDDGSGLPNVQLDAVAVSAGVEVTGGVPQPASHGRHVGVVGGGVVGGVVGGRVVGGRVGVVTVEVGPGSGLSWPHAVRPPSATTATAAAARARRRIRILKRLARCRAGVR
jgi:hypothetical protein